MVLLRSLTCQSPHLKTLEQLDWEALKDVSRQKIMELASCSS
jgi:hypothetical protein